MPELSARVTGKLLSKKWGVDAAHPLYSKDGSWYHPLKRFPGVLFDPAGYVVFQTRDEYQSSPYLDHKKDLHVTYGISSMPGYVLWASKQGAVQKTPVAVDFEEQKRIPTTAYRILRDTALARRIKRDCQFKCQLCGFTLILPDGTSYAEAHHIKPLGSPHNGPDIEGNILCLCPNHHAALDYGVLRIEPDQIQGIHKNAVAAEFIDHHNDRVAKLSRGA